MRVVQLLPELNEGGVERGTVELSRELVKMGHESIVISSGGKLVSKIGKEGGRHELFDVSSKNPFSVPSRVTGLRRLLDEIDPDIVHARSRVPAWLAYMANRKSRRPFVTTVHGFNSINRYSRIMTAGERVICVSEAVKSYIVDAYDTPLEKIRVIPRGIDPDIFDPAKLDREFMDDFVKRHDLKNRYVATVAGRITQLKGIEVFLDALAQARKSVPELVGLIVGGVRSDKERYFETLLERATDLDLEGCVLFVGSIDKMAEIYALSDVVVNSSLKAESFGRSAAEALAMGTPVIAAAHGGILDIVIPEKTGWLFAPGDSDALAKALVASTNGSFDDLGTYAMKNFSLRKMVEKTIEVYKELL